MDEVLRLTFWEIEALFQDSIDFVFSTSFLKTKNNVTNK